MVVTTTMSSSYRRWTLVTMMLSFMMVADVWSICPHECRCVTYTRDRKQVICDEGGMMVNIPTQLMENDIWRLVVTAPLDNLNNLAISQVFYKFTRLREIHITNSLLPAIGDGTFKGLVSLEILNLTANNITQLLETNFQDLRSVKSLHLDYNKIQFMPSAAFHNMPNLRKLTMSNNRITALVTRLFLNLTNLEVLDLKSNPLQKNVNEDVFKDVRKLRSLNLSDCQQTHFNALLLKHLPVLEVLDLSYNRLPYFSIEDAYYAPHLRELYLRGNRITTISNTTFYGLNLKILTLSFNQLQVLHRDSFVNVTINELDLSYNQVEISDPHLLAHLSGKLQSLYIGGNRMSQSTLGRMLQNLPFLQSLGIGGLNLKKIDSQVLRFLPTLRALNISRNGLESLPVQCLAPLRHLQILDLSRNDFKGLDQNLINQLDAMRSLRILYMQENPWTCDLCYIPVLMSWLNRSRQFQGACRPGSPEGLCLRCAHPPELEGEPFQLLDYGSLAGCHGDGAQRSVAFHQGHVGLAVACILLLLLLVTAVIVLLMYYRRGADYYTHEEEREDDAIYENLGVDDETGDLLDDKKTKVLLPPSPFANAHHPHHVAADGNGHAAHDGRQFGRQYTTSGVNATAGCDNGRVGDQC